MTLNKSNQDNISQRREAVASLRLRGLTIREIAISLSKQQPPILNADGKPYSAATIKLDLDKLKEEWRASANVHTDEHVARQAAEIAEIKRAAWGAKDPDLALKALSLEMKLYGTMKQPSGVTININLDVITRFEATARDLNVDAESAIEQFRQMLIAQSTTTDSERSD